MGKWREIDGWPVFAGVKPGHLNMGPVGYTAT